MGILGIFARGRLGGDGLFLSTGSVVSFDKQEFSKNRSKNAASLRAKRRMRKTANFGGRLLCAGNSSFGELDPVGSEQRQREGPTVRETEN